MNERVSRGQKATSSRKTEASSPNPICDATVGPLYEHIRATYPLSRFGLGMHQNTKGERWLVISMIEVEREARGQGIGSDVMKHITDVADRNGWTLALTPSAKVDAYDPQRLGQWYEKFGFEYADPISNNLFMCDESMIRRPRS